jgi:hypothetical protein
MAIATRTYQTTDWQVWTYTPESDAFILNKSKLNSGILGSTGGSMTPNTSEITSISISEGGEPSSGIFTSPESASLSVGLMVKDFTVAESEKYFIGSPIWVTLKNEETVPEKRFGLNTPIFIGKITSFDAPVMPGMDFTEVIIEATSNTADMLNMLLTVEKNITEDKYYWIEESAYVQYPPSWEDEDETYGTWFVDLRFFEAGRFYNFANTDTETKSVGEWLTDYNNCEQWVCVDSVKPYYFPFNDGTETFIDYVSAPQLSYNEPYLPFVTTTYTDDDIHSCTLGWSGGNSPTGVNLSLASDGEISYVYGTTQENLSSSAFLYSQTLDVKNLTQLQEIGLKTLSMAPNYTATSLSVEVARTGQEIEFRSFDNVFFDERFLQPKKLAYAGDQIKITISDLGITDQIMIVTGRQIEVTPDTFSVTYNLWKGFTN